MISKEDFIKGITTYQNGIKFIDSLSDLGVDVLDSPLNLSTDTLFDMWLKQITGDKGADLIYWWLFDDVEKKIYNLDGEETDDLEDIESLYNYMNTNEYF